MPYWEIVTRSFRIAWERKYLWLIALFSGEGGGGFSFNYNQSTGNNQVSPAEFQRQVTTWLTDHFALVVFLAILWLVLIVVFFILGAVCEGATVRASAEHDAERPFGLGMAWRSGVATMWVIVRFRLLLIALYLPLLALIAVWLVGLFIAIANHKGYAAPVLILTGLLLFAVWIVYAIYLFFLDRFGTRAVVLEQLQARASIVRAHQLLFKRFGRALLVLLVAVAVALVLGIVLACFSVLVVVPVVAAFVFAGSTGAGALAPLLVLAAVIFVPIYLVVAAFLAAQGSTYWTLAFRRMDIDYAPAFAYPAAPPAPQQ